MAVITIHPLASYSFGSKPAPEIEKLHVQQDGGESTVHRQRGGAQYGNGQKADASIAAGGGGATYMNALKDRSSAAHIQRLKEQYPIKGMRKTVEGGKP